MNSDTNHPLPPADPEAIEATAAVWLSLRDRGMNETETAEFMHWMQEHPRHAEVFGELDAVWRDFNRLSVARPVGTAQPTASLLEPRARPRHRGRLLATTFAAAAALAYVGARQYFNPPHTAVTEIGAFQKLDLPDGSVVQLNTDSAIDVRFTAGERRVNLVRGEAHFTVAHNPARPFIVSAGAVAVRAVGTAFNVRLRSTAVEVLVTEGKVQVNDTVKGRTLLAPQVGTDTPLLVAGERAVIPNLAPGPEPAPIPVAAIAPLEVERALAWQERRLEFEDTPLAEVVAEFNRYNQHKIVIDDPRLETMRFGGTFRADGYEPFVRLLESGFGVTAERTEHETRLRLAP
jgi:transmembrane sensor